MPDEQQKLLDLEEKPPNTVEDLLRVAQEASAEIEAEEVKAYLEDEQWIRDQRYRLERLETNHTMNVFAAKVDPKDADSKPLFTNEAMRKAEVGRRLSADPAYQEQMAALMVMEKNQKLRRISYRQADQRLPACTFSLRCRHFRPSRIRRD